MPLIGGDWIPFGMGKLDRLGRLSLGDGPSTSSPNCAEMDGRLCCPFGDLADREGVALWIAGRVSDPLEAMNCLRRGEVARGLEPWASEEARRSASGGLSCWRAVPAVEPASAGSRFSVATTDG